MNDHVRDSMINESLIINDTYYTRSFVLEEFGDRSALVGVTHPQEILPGVNIAQCQKHQETSPIEQCTCGFYAYLTKRNSDLYTHYSNHVRAVIRGFGRTIVQENGVRLENIEIVALSSTHLHNRQILKEKFPNIPVYKSDRELFAKTKNIYPIQNVKFDKNLLKTQQETKQKLTPRTDKIWEMYPHNETRPEKTMRLLSEPIALLGTLLFFCLTIAMMTTHDLISIFAPMFIIILMIGVTVNLFASYVDAHRFHFSFFIINIFTPATIFALTSIPFLQYTTYYFTISINAVMGIILILQQIRYFGAPTKHHKYPPKVLVNAKIMKSN